MRAHFLVRHWYWLPAVVVLPLAGAVAQTFTDDFDGYPNDGDGWPTWEADAVGIVMRHQAVEADGGVLRWRKVPYAAAVTFRCQLTVLAEVGRPEDWLTAGIGIMSDRRNYYQLNLVRAPKREKFRHFLELHECLSGHWLAESAEATRLVRLNSKGDAYDWRLGETYDLEMTLTPGRVNGRVTADGRELGRFGFRVPARVRAVRGGRPCLRAAGLRVRFDNAVATVSRKAPEPTVAPHFPPWVSRPGQRVTKGTGYFSTYRDHSGRWWLVDPEGKPFFDVGVDHCNYNAHYCQALGYAPYHRNMQKKFGGAAAWAASAVARLKAWHFNTLAAGHHPATRHRGLCHILFASFGSRFARRDWICEPVHWTGFPNVFSPEWPRHCRLVARQLAKESRGDPWCLGTFYDNELEWYGKGGFLVDELFKLPPDHTAKQAFWDWLVNRYHGVDGVNEALNTHYGGRAAFLAADVVPHPTEALDTVRNEFLTVIGERYFRACYEALKGADPHHLAMGCRFAGRAPEPVLAAAGRYTDVFTINTYPRIDLDRRRLLGVQRQFRDYYTKVGKPFVITEWSFPALDSGLPCKHGAGMRVDTQAQKARCYQIFATAMSTLPFMVGYHYFMWVDEPEQGISDTFPEDSNYGLVDVNDTPYEKLVAMATRVNAAAFRLHKRSVFSGDLELTVRGGVPVLHNHTRWTARGTVTAFVHGRLRRLTVSVQPGKNATPPGIDWKRAAFVLLKQWDGTLSRAALRAPRQEPVALNAGGEAVRDVPVVYDGNPLRLTWITELAPGGQAPLEPVTTPLQPVEELLLETGKAAFHSSPAAGSLFDGVVALSAGKERPLGRLDFAAHQLVGSQHQWVAADTREHLRVAETPTGWVVEAVVAFRGNGRAITAVDEHGRPAPQQTGPARFRASVRAVVFKDAALALVRPLWVESLDTRPWRLIDCFWFCRPVIGGATDNDRKGGPDVPNYYRPAEFWTDARLGGAFGALSPGNEWNVHFWVDESGGFHPDARRNVDRVLKPGERWTADGWPYLWVYALTDGSRVNTLVSRAGLAGNLLVTGGAG